MSTKSTNGTQRAGNASGRRELGKSGITRQRILDAAARIFAEKGYGRTPMGEIAQEAGIHITALYYHFSTKDDLAEGVINHGAQLNYAQIVERLDELSREATFIERFRVAVRAQLEGVVARRSYVLAQSKILSEVPEARQERHRALLRQLADLWRGLLREGRAAGMLREDLDLSVARMILQGSINWTIEWYRPGGRDIAEIAGQIADTILIGMQ